MSEELINNTEVMDEPVSKAEDDWSDVDTSDITPEQDEAEETDEQEAEGEPAKADQQKQETPDEPKAPDVIKVTLNGKLTELPIKEAEQLIGRGQAWKELAQERDALAKKAKEAEVSNEFVSELARASGLSVAEFIRLSKMKVYTDAGYSEADARQKLADDEARAKDRADAERLRAQERAQEEAKQKREADIREFAQEFPTVSPDSIPKAVWDKVQNGMSLVNAWLKHELDRQRTENAQLKQRKTNAEISPGSVASQGTQKKDPFLEGWDS